MPRPASRPSSTSLSTFCSSSISVLTWRPRLRPLRSSFFELARTWSRFELIWSRSSRAAVRLAAAPAGGQQEARRERGKEKRGCSEATHDSSLENTSESIFTLHVDRCFACSVGFLPSRSAADLEPLGERRRQSRLEDRRARPRPRRRRPGGSGRSTRRCRARARRRAGRRRAAGRRCRGSAAIRPRRGRAGRRRWSGRRWRSCRRPVEGGRVKKSETWEWPIRQIRSLWASRPASAWSIESTYSQIGSRGEAWKRPKPSRSPSGERPVRNSSVSAEACSLRPVDRRPRRLREGRRVDRPDHRQVVVAVQGDRAALPHQRRALVRLGAVADHVAEAPDLLRPGGLDRLEHRLQGREIGMDV